MQNQPTTPRPTKSLKAKGNFEKNGKYSTKSIRIQAELKLKLAKNKIL
jgi:hypothetical protein